jgi:hypothetical protein
MIVTDLCPPLTDRTSDIACEWCRSERQEERGIDSADYPVPKAVPVRSHPRTDQTALAGEQLRSGNFQR